MSNFARSVCTSAFRGLNRLRSLEPNLRRVGVGEAASVPVVVAVGGWMELVPKSRKGISLFDPDDDPTGASSFFFATSELIFGRKNLLSASIVLFFICSHLFDLYDVLV